MAIHVYYPKSDGWAEHFSAGGLSFTDIKLASGNFSNGTSETMTVRLQSDNVTNIWKYNRRIKISFDTSNLNSVTDIITAGNLQMKVSDVLNEFSYDFGLCLYASTATTTTIQNSDYEKNPFLATQLATSVDWTDYDTNDTLELDLNSNGFSYIKMDGDTIFSIRESNYDASAFSPSWESDKNAVMTLRSSEYTGTDNDPKLIIVVDEISVIRSQVWTDSEFGLAEEAHIYTNGANEQAEAGFIYRSSQWGEIFDDA